MTEVRYEVVEHDGGWAYKVGDVLSETYPSHEAALIAAHNAAVRQSGLQPDSVDGITYQDEDGRWKEESSGPGERPHTRVVDKG